jgi:hypothetical protein
VKDEEANELTRALSEIAVEAQKVMRGKMKAPFQPAFRDRKIGKIRIGFMPDNLKCSWILWQRYQKEPDRESKYRQAVRLEKINRLLEPLQFQLALSFDKKFQVEIKDIFVDKNWVIWRRKNIKIRQRS